ncbi:hypothetical protein Neosp_007921 [[Neocosmospora] mangrovei]
MAEPISLCLAIAGSVLTILRKVGPILVGFSDAEENIRQLESIVQGLHGILEQYQNLWQADRTGLGLIVGHLDTCSSSLLRLEGALKSVGTLTEEQSGSAKKNRGVKMLWKNKPVEKGKWVVWVKKLAQEHLPFLEAAKRNLSMSFEVCEAARRQEGLRQVLDQGQQHYASLVREIRESRPSNDLNFTNLSTRMDAITLDPQDPKSYQPSDTGANFGDDYDYTPGQRDEYNQARGAILETPTTMVQLPDISYRMQIYISDSYGTQSRNFLPHSLAIDYLPHSLAVDYTSKCCWVSRKYLVQVNLGHLIKNDISRNEKSENKQTFGSTSYWPSGYALLSWRLIDNPSAVWMTRMFYVFDEIAVPDAHFVIYDMPYAHQRDPNEIRQANGDETSFVDYTLSDGVVVQTGADYLTEQDCSPGEFQTRQEEYCTPQMSVATQGARQYTDDRTGQAGPSTRAVPRSLIECDDRESAQESKDRTRSRNHRSGQAEAGQSTRPTNHRRKKRDKRS